MDPTADIIGIDAPVTGDKMKLTRITAAASVAAWLTLEKFVSISWKSEMSVTSG